MTTDTTTQAIPETPQDWLIHFTDEAGRWLRVHYVVVHEAVRDDALHVANIHFGKLVKAVQPWGDAEYGYAVSASRGLEEASIEAAEAHTPDWRTVEV